MSDVKTGSCLVCAELATLRCSRCAREAGIDLFFCSKEHQALVWPAHKLVCGSRAHPFRLPGFTQAEADGVLQWVRTPPSSLVQIQARVQFENEYLQSLVGHGGSMNPPENSIDDQVLTIRKCDFDWRVPPTPWMPPLYGGRSLGAFIMAYAYMTEVQVTPTDKHWYSEFCHRFLSLHELLQSFSGPGQLKRGSEREAANLMELVTACSGAAVRLLRQRASPGFVPLSFAAMFEGRLGF